MAAKLDASSTTVNRELDRIAALEKDWDSQGAHAIDSRIIASARDVVSSLPLSSGAIPAVVPMRKGNLQFEWHDGPRTLEIEIESPSTIRYLKVNPEANTEEEGSCPIRDMDTITELIQWFTKG